MPYRPTGRPPGRPPYPGLVTPAELRVLELVREGLTTPQIALRLGVSQETVHTHITHLTSKLDVQGRTELARWQPPADSTPVGHRRWWAYAPFSLLRYARTPLVSGLAAGTVVAAMVGIAALLPRVRSTGEAPTVASVVVTSSPASLASGRIAFVSQGDGNGEIYTMKGDGSDLRNLTNDLADDSAPAWSPDGSRIAFVSDRDGNFEIYTMGVDGSNVVRLTLSPSRDDSPAWSPDGSRIAFTSDRDGNREIYSVRADGSGQMNLTNDPADDSAPAWSPDGGRIAFVSDRDGDEDIYTMHADGSNPTRIPVASDGRNPATSVGVGGPIWSPDGTHISFSGYTRDLGGGLYGEVYVIRADGSEPLSLEWRHGQSADATWSPDGTRIAFVSFRDGDSEIYVNSSDGSGLVKQLTNNVTGDSEPAWSPVP